MNTMSINLVELRILALLSQRELHGLAAIGRGVLSDAYVDRPAEVQDALYAVAVSRFVGSLLGRCLIEMQRHPGDPLPTYRPTTLGRKASEMAQTEHARQAAQLDSPQLLMSGAWTPAADALLGTDTDGAVGDRLGLYGGDVSKRRCALGILGYGRVRQESGGIGWKRTRHEFNWTDEADALLPHFSMAALAVRLNTSAQEVRSRMVALGIPVPLSATAKKVVWSADMDAVLHRMGAVEAAKSLDVSLDAVNRRCKELQAAVSKKMREQESFPSAVNWFSRVIHGETYAEIAHSCGVTGSAVCQRVKNLCRRLNHLEIPVQGEAQSAVKIGATWFPSMLRGNKDFYLARLRHFCDVNAINHDRIVSERPVRAAPIKPVWTLEMEALLGTMSDAVLAAKLGTSGPYVRQRRLALQINSFGGGGLDSRTHHRSRK